MMLLWHGESVHFMTWFLVRCILIIVDFIWGLAHMVKRPRSAMPFPGVNALD